MLRTFDEHTWLSWLTKVRIMIITFLLGIGLTIVRLTHTNVAERAFVSVILLWYTVAVFFIVLHSVWHESWVQARLQVLTDLVLATALIYVTGGIDTSFNFLYPLVIIVASILLPRWWAYLTAALSFIAFGAILDLSYYQIIRSFSITRPDLKSAQLVIGINFFAYMAIAYLSSNLSAKLRQVDVELHVKSDELEDLQAIQENILHSMRGGLITTDLDGKVTLINQPGLNFLGRRSSEILGTDVSSLFLDPVPEPNSEAVQGELRAATPQGEKIFGITVTPLTIADGDIIGLVYTFADLTDVRRLENEIRLRDRLSAVGRLAAGIAHEIRNPLSSIAGSVQVLSNIATLNEEQRVLVDIVRRESERLNSIISDFLLYSRDKSYSFSRHDLLLLLEDTLRLLDHRPSRSGATYRIVRSFEVREALAVVDPDRLKQVFWNLCDNALRAMPGGGTLRVTLRERGLGPPARTPHERSEMGSSTTGPAPAPGAGVRAGGVGHWLLSFKDTGIGLRPEQVEKIFEPFQSNFEGGTGLGLALVYQIVQAHGGRVYALSLPGEGAELIVEIPQVEAQAPALPPVPRARVATAPERVNG